MVNPPGSVLNPEMVETVKNKIRERHALPPPEDCKRLRVQSGMSQVDVARVLTASGVPVTAQSVCLWESGRRWPSGVRLSAYLELLELLRSCTVGAI